MLSENAYSRPVTLKNVLRFAVPTIVMTVFMSFYTMVDGLFVSNLIGTDALSAVNLTAPIISLVTAISTMLATGGSAVIMRKVGEQKATEANEDFTFLIVVNVIVGLVMSVLGYLVMDGIFGSMNLSPVVFDHCHDYLSRYLIFTIPILLMNNFTLYMIAAGKSDLSMVCSITGGVLNMVLDYVLIAVLDMGIAGAAIATGLGYSVTAVVGIVLMFATSLYTGYSYGVAPMISFYYGEQNHGKLKKLIRMSLKIISVIAAVTLIASLVVTEPLVSVFARPDNPVYDLAVTGNRICSFALIFIGFNVFASGMFTALSNGLISAVLAFSRSFVFMVIAMLILPALFGVTGVWFATPAAEFAAICLSLIMFGRYQKKYGY